MNKRLLEKRLSDLLVIVPFLLNFCLLCVSVFAYDYDTPPTDFTQFGVVVENAIKVLITVAGLALVAMVGYGVWKSSMATGDSRALEGAKSTWAYALYGFFIVVGAMALLGILSVILGVNVNGTFVSGIVGALNELLHVADNPGGNVTP